MRRRAAPGRRWPGRAGRLALLVGLVLALAACSGDDEDRSPRPAVPVPETETGTTSPLGVRAELVLPAPEHVDDAVLRGLHRRLEALAGAPPDGIRQLRVHRPEDAGFVGELAGLLAADGHELVCVLGPRAVAAAEPVAERYRGVDVCGMPSEASTSDDDDEPQQVVVADAPVEVLGELVGVAARTAAEARAIQLAAEEAAEADDAEDPDDGPAGPPDPEPATVGLVLLGGELPERRFRDGLLVGLAGAEVLRAEDTSADPVEQLEAVVLAGAHVVVVDGGAGASEVVEAGDDRVLLMAPPDVIDAADVPEEEVALRYRLRLERLVERVLETRVDRGELDGAFTLRVGEPQLFVLEPGGANTAGLAAARNRLEELIGERGQAPVPSGGAERDAATSRGG